MTAEEGDPALPVDAGRKQHDDGHGGVVASVLDTTGALAAWSNHDFDKGARASTVSMNVQFLGAAKRSDLVCTARAVKRGRELIFTEITATDADGEVVAHAVQTYRIV